MSAPEPTAGQKQKLLNRMFLQCVEARHLERARKCVASGASLDLVGHEALMIAIGKGDEDMVDLLLDAGADPRQWNQHSLIAASRAGHHRIITMLARAGCAADLNGSAAILEAIAHSKPNAVRSLLEAGSDPNAGGGRLLREAVKTGNRESVRLLLEAGADPLAGNRMSIAIAKRRNLAEITEMLVMTCTVKGLVEEDIFAGLPEVDDESLSDGLSF